MSQFPILPFLMDSLVTTSQLALLEHAERTSELLNRISGLLKYSQRNKEEVLLADEITALKDYLAVQQQIRPSKFDFSFNDKIATIPNIFISRMSLVNAVAQLCTEDFLRTNKSIYYVITVDYFDHYAVTVARLIGDQVEAEEIFRQGIEVNG